MSPDFRPPSALGKILPLKTPTSKLNSPSLVTTPAKVSNDTTDKSMAVMNATSLAKANVSTLKSSSIVKNNPAINSSSSKSNIAKAIVTNANGKCPQSVKINNYVQSKTLPMRRNNRNSPNLGRNKDSKSKVASDKVKSNALKKCGNESENNAVMVSSDEESEVCQAKLNSIRHRAVQRQQEDTNNGK